ncbi:unnamed protein product [Pedinophyceae sp. YPF-701]|nr:unnamed protein product [Pedinophyceae sp. YPF-701]
MYVPSDSFGGKSPERLSADQLRKLFTFAAARIVLAQLEGNGRAAQVAGSSASYNSEQHSTLHAHLLDVRMADPEEWLGALMRKNTSLAMRVIEVRKAYAEDDFEWHKLQEIAKKDIALGNQALMRDVAESSFSAEAVQGAGSQDDDGGAHAPSPRA